MHAFVQRIRLTDSISLFVLASKPIRSISGSDICSVFLILNIGQPIYSCVAFFTRPVLIRRAQGCIPGNQRSPSCESMPTGNALLVVLLRGFLVRFK